MSLPSELVWGTTESTDLRILPPQENELELSHASAHDHGLGLLPGAEPPPRAPAGPACRQN